MTRVYHRGDLRTALLVTAMELIEQGAPFSMRAVTRRAGVSLAAPYRHFADRDDLESALAVEGLRDLKADLRGACAAPSSVSDVAELAVAYVSFALRRPALFRLMFGNESDHTDDDRVHAAAELHELLATTMANVFPGADADALASACWALAHGLAFLHLDGKFAATTPDEVATRVQSSFEAIFSVAGATD